MYQYLQILFIFFQDQSWTAELKLIRLPADRPKPGNFISLKLDLSNSAGKKTDVYSPFWIGYVDINLVKWYLIKVYHYITISDIQQEGLYSLLLSEHESQKEHN